MYTIPAAELSNKYECIPNQKDVVSRPGTFGLWAAIRVRAGRDDYVLELVRTMAR